MIFLDGTLKATQFRRHALRKCSAKFPRYDPRHAKRPFHRHKYQHRLSAVRQLRPNIPLVDLETETAFAIASSVTKYRTAVSPVIDSKAFRFVARHPSLN